MRYLILAVLSGCAMNQQQSDALGSLGAALLMQQPAYQNSGVGGGILKGSSVSGFNRICYYDKLGNTYAVTVPATSLCPIPGP